MILHSVLISYNRPELTKRALQSYRDTVTVPHYLVVVDNASDDDTRDWLQRCDRHGFVDAALLLGANVYPGKAFNYAIQLGLLGNATHLHRLDNDFVFLPGWCDHVQEAFARSRKIGQVGLRTLEQEGNAPNVGGNMILRRELWDAGLRYDERPWPEYPPGYSEDSFLSPAVKEMGWRWTRVKEQCIVPISHEDPEDPYYQRSWGDRNMYGYEPETT